MNKLFALAALAAAVVIASPASAASLSGQVQFANPVGLKKPDATGYELTYNDTLVKGLVNVGADLYSAQPKGNGSVNTVVSVQAGPALPRIAGFQPVVYGEFGRSLQAGKDSDFYGYDVGASHTLIGPVSADVGYRHRQGLSTKSVQEDRLNGGVSYQFDNNIVGVEYYRTRALGVSSDTVGVGYTRKF